MRKIILSVILIAILVLSIFSMNLFPDAATLGAHVVELKIDTGDTAWMIVATAFVLLMTPGLGFFTEVWLVRKMLLARYYKVLLP
jgi:Amt family ammonium transporter